MTKGAEKLRALRVARGMSQDDVAQATGLARWQIDELEHGEATPSPSVAEVLSDWSGLEISPDDWRKGAAQ